MPRAERGTPPPIPGRSAAKAGLTAALLLLLQACAATPPPTPEPGGATPPAPPPAAGAAAIDGRLQVDAQEYPWSAIGRLNRAGQGFCNGILIGPQQVLTQARCLYAAREGRWFQPLELHFIAAYQSDSYLADSAVADFTAAPGFNPKGGSSLSNLTNNWAVVLLRDAIGSRTGWLGVEWDSRGLQTAAENGRAAYLRAGYRHDWPHSISLHFGCGGSRGALVDLCAPTPSELALPSFVLGNGELRVLGDHYLRSAAQGGELARLAASTISDNRLGRANPPAASSPVRRQPQVSVSRFLAGLGYDVEGRGLDAAIADYLRDRGLPVRRGASLDLLTSLLNAAQKQGGS